MDCIENNESIKDQYCVPLIRVCFSSNTALPNRQICYSTRYDLLAE